MSSSATEWVELPHNMGRVRRSTRNTAPKRNLDESNDFGGDDAGSRQTFSGDDAGNRQIVDGHVTKKLRSGLEVKSKDNKVKTKYNREIDVKSKDKVQTEGPLAKHNIAEISAGKKCKSDDATSKASRKKIPTSTASTTAWTSGGPTRTATTAAMTSRDPATTDSASINLMSTGWPATAATSTGSTTMAASTSTDQTSTDRTRVKVYKPSKYDYTPRHTPYPNHPKPSPADCEEVYRLLLNLHAKDDKEGLKFQQPAEIPPPSMTHAGCGEVPDLLDGLLRTRLSAATMSRHAAASIQGLKERFGFGTGIHEATINWEAVRQADVEVIEQAIFAGGLAPKKSRDIRDILHIVYDSNGARRYELLEVQKSPAYSLDPSVRSETDFKLHRLEQNMLSMDHILDMSTEEAMLAMMELPGIAVKTAACVVLFRMQRPSFAVDTHVQRFCSWLGWVPGHCKSADKTFNHGQQRVPDHLKYPLHQLFLAHGKACLRCRADTSPSSEGYDECVCPIEHLVVRTGKMKEKGKNVSGDGSKKKKKMVAEEEDDVGGEEEFGED